MDPDRITISGSWWFGVVLGSVFWEYGLFALELGRPDFEGWSANYCTRLIALRNPGPLMSSTWLPWIIFAILPDPFKLVYGYFGNSVGVFLDWFRLVFDCGSLALGWLCFDFECVSVLVYLKLVELGKSALLILSTKKWCGVINKLIGHLGISFGVLFGALCMLFDSVLDYVWNVVRSFRGCLGLVLKIGCQILLKIGCLGQNWPPNLKEQCLDDL